ncbi:uncharacterized protein LOC122825873 [Gambusia affinis]|uniref:uncharacterized protein LOC122825873 n=1 Tax=Gambusia affinis TaxID=33528 RepID=UPI001CDD86C4|nr:uncharacterized protein LOC122825873 [Gambusia affinis]
MTSARLTRIQDLDLVRLLPPQVGTLPCISASLPRHFVPSSASAQHLLHSLFLSRSPHLLNASAAADDPVPGSSCLLINIRFTAHSCVVAEFLGPSSVPLQYNLATMDPSHAQEWRATVEKSIIKLEANMEEMMSMLSKLTNPTAPPSASAAPRQAPPQLVRLPLPQEPRLSPPEVFCGEPSQCRPFITQCEIHFELQPSSFPSERAKVAYMISLLSGKAKIWGTAEWQKDSILIGMMKPCVMPFTKV